MKGKLCFKKKTALDFSEVLGRGKKNPLTGMKRLYNGLAAAFISIHACHNMYIFASDGNPSITRGLSDHDGVATVVGVQEKKPV